MGITDQYQRAPKLSEFEFSILGGGSAYGESIVLHLGNNKWGIIDNCLNQKTRKPLALEYLKEIGVSFENVKFILCTHWHQDHITNITSVLEKCSNADFYMSSALNSQEFSNLLHFKSSIYSNFNPAKEFSKLVNYLKDSGRKLKRVNQDQILFEGFIANTPIRLFSLTPTEETKQYFEVTIKNLLANLEAGIADIIFKPEPNLQSVVTCIDIGGSFSALLGADLENSKIKGLGWQGIFDSTILKNCSKGIIFKIPHHGSENGYNEEIWKELVLSTDSKVVTTPMIKGSSTLIPTKDMISKICAFSNNFNLTSDPYEVKLRKHDRPIQKTIKSLKLNIEKIPFQFGQIRIRKDFKVKSSSSLILEKFGEALSVSC